MFLDIFPLHFGMCDFHIWSCPTKFSKGVPNKKKLVSLGSGGFFARWFSSFLETRASQSERDCANRWENWMGENRYPVLEKLWMILQDFCTVFNQTLRSGPKSNFMTILQLKATMVFFNPSVFGLNGLTWTKYGLKWQVEYFLSCSGSAWAVFGHFGPRFVAKVAILHYRHFAHSYSDLFA